MGDYAYFAKDPGQLEVCQLFQCGDQVVYSKGLNGGLQPVLTSLTASLAQGANMLDAPTSKPSFLPVDLSQVTLGNHAPEASAPHRTSTSSSPSHLAMEHPLSRKADSHIRMTAEVWELLFHAMLDTSSQASGAPAPKRPNLQPWGSHPHQSGWFLQASSYFFSGITTGDYAWHHWANHPTSQGGLHSYYPSNQNSWGWHGHPPWGSDFTSREDEQYHGAPTYDQGIHRCSSKEKSTRLWDGHLLKWSQGHWSH